MASPGAARPTDGPDPIHVLSLPGRRYPQNPYLRQFCDAFADTPVRIVDLRSWRALLFRVDVIHVHFPEHYVSAQTLPRACVWVSLYAAYFLAAKLFGRRIVWTVHNVVPSQNRHPWLLGPWMRLFRRLVDGHVFLSRWSREQFARQFPAHAGKPSCVVPHGAFAVEPVDPGRRDALRASLVSSGDDCLVGFLGSIKRYKNIGALCALPPRLADGRRVRTVVAGLPDWESRADLDKTARTMGDRMVLLERHIDDHELNHLIAAMDVVILPYLRGWNSGLAMLVLGNGGRLLTSDLPMFRELADAAGAPWVTLFNDDLHLAGALERASHGRIDDAAEHKLRRFLAVTSFEAGAGHIATFYASLAILRSPKLSMPPLNRKRHREMRSHAASDAHGSPERG